MTITRKRGVFVLTAIAIVGWTMAITSPVPCRLRLRHRLGKNHRRAMISWMTTTSSSRLSRQRGT